MKNLGSEEWGTAVIKSQEADLLVTTMIENGSTPELAALELEALDDILSIARMRVIVSSRRFTSTGRIRKDSALSDMIDKRVDLLRLEIQKINQ